MNEPIRRTDTVKLKLAPEIMARFEEQARSFGMPPSTLAAFAVADWLQRQENTAKLARMAVLDVARNACMTDESMERVLASVLPGITKALGQENLPLDHEETKGAK